MNDATHPMHPHTGRKMDELILYYEGSHRNRTNEIIHVFAVPTIMLSIMGILYAIHPYLCFALLAFSGAYYLRVASLPYFFGMVAYSVLGLLLIMSVPKYLIHISIGVFVIAWIFQFIGHHVEGRKPSFFEDLQYLLVGPLFVLVVLKKYFSK